MQWKSKHSIKQNNQQFTNTNWCDTSPSTFCTRQQSSTIRRITLFTNILYKAVMPLEYFACMRNIFWLSARVSWKICLIGKNMQGQNYRFFHHYSTNAYVWRQATWCFRAGVSNRFIKEGKFDNVKAPCASISF